MTTTTTAVSVPTTGAYRLDPDTCLIEFTTRHMFGLAPVTGTFQVVSGDLTIAEPLTASRLDAAASVSSFHTGNPERDEHVRSGDFLDAANHPLILFSSTSLERNGDSWSLHGVLTARGTAAPLVLRVLELREDGEVLHLRATARVDRFAHGVTRMPRMAARHLTLVITARAVRVQLSAG